MLISEVSKQTGLTKKSIGYYIDQGLISPLSLGNGYREFGASDIESLQKIAVLRRLGLGVEEIKAVLADQTTQALHKLSAQKALEHKREQFKLVALEKLGNGTSYEEVERELKGLNQSAAIIDRLLDAFPGYYGRYISLHFSRFLNMPITTEEQQAAYKQVVEFLDHLDCMAPSPELEELLQESVNQISVQQIEELLTQTKRAVESPEVFLTEHKETIEAYLQFRQSEAYKSSPAYQLREWLLELYKASGYYERFIPAMQRLSPSYAQYHVLLSLANDQFLAQYPQAGEQYSDKE